MSKTNIDTDSSSSDDEPLKTLMDKSNLRKGMLSNQTIL